MSEASHEKSALQECIFCLERKKHLLQNWLENIYYMYR